METYLKTSQVCQLLSISLSTFYRYVKAGLIKPAFFTSGGHRRISLSSIISTFNLHNNDKHQIVCYSRVSSHQKSYLQRQHDKLLNFALNLPQFNPNFNFNTIISISDLGSGLNYNKKGLKQLLNLIFKGQVQSLIINHKDRLLRFGSEIIFHLCDLFNVNVIIVEDTSSLSFEETLASDVIEIMTVFCAKLYGRRSHKNKQSLT